MAKNLTPVQKYSFITTDFEDVWDSVASNKKANGRGNFLFANLAMEFLEFTCRLCESDKTGKALRDFSSELNKIDSKYFTKIHGLNVSREREFLLPYVVSQTQDFLVCALFDLVRNGLAHQYQQILVRMTDGKTLGITLTGPGKRAKPIHLRTVRTTDRSKMTHFKLRKDKDGDLWLTISPARLYLDFKNAFDNAGLLKRSLTFHSLTRPDPAYPKKVYNFSSSSIMTDFLPTTKGGFASEGRIHYPT